MSETVSYNYKVGRKGQADILFKPQMATEQVSDHWRSAKLYGLHLLDQSNIYFPEPKQRETISYIELDGEEVGSVSVDNEKLAYEPFDYWVEFAFFGERLFNKTNYFFIALEELLKNNLNVLLINTYTGVSLSAYYVKTEIEENKRVIYRNTKDFLRIKVYFRVSKPNECDFAMQENFGLDIYVDKEKESPIYDIMNLYPTINFSPIIKFVDDKVKALCVANWDLNGDGELSEDEASMVTSLNGVFAGSGIESFEELKYFTSLAKIDDNAFSGCSFLSKVDFADTTTQIGEGAFRQCEALDVIDISNINVVDNYAFQKSKISLLRLSKDSFSFPLGLCSQSIIGTFVVELNACRFAPAAFQDAKIDRMRYGIKNPEVRGHQGKTSFFYQSEIRELTIDSNIEEIPHCVFTKTKIQTLRMLPVEPPTIAEDTFLPDLITEIRIPKNSVNAYNTAQVWRWLLSNVRVILE